MDDVERAYGRMYSGKSRSQGVTLIVFEHDDYS
jgi:hypothetical protein